ncbi:MAG: beta strand repeat-containing protein, partial [Planctomycetota bacterium]
MVKRVWVGAAVGAALLMAVSTANAAPCVSGTDVQVIPMHRPLGATARPFYADIGTTKRSGYAGWELVEANSSVLGDDVWVQVHTFSDTGTLGLASGQSPAIPARGTSSNGKPLVYAYLTALAETSTAQTFTVEVFNGKPGAGGVSVCTYQDSFLSVLDVISASANKVTSVSASTTSPVVGGSFDVTAIGDTGQTGNGPSTDQDGGNGVFSMAPANDDAWPADAFTLTGVRLTLGGTSYRDRLRAYPSTSGAYTAVYSFTVRQTKNTTTPIRPAQNIASGNGVKYTGQYDSGAQVNLAATSVSTSFAKGASGVTNMGSQTFCSVGSATTFYRIDYEVTVSNQATTPAVVDLFSDTPSVSGTWCVVTGQTQLDSTTIDDPTRNGSDIVFEGPHTIPAATTNPGSITIRYQLYTTGTTSNGITGAVGGETISSTTAGANQVSVNPANPTVTTASVPSGSTGVSYSQTLTATGGSGSGYTWALDAGSGPLPNGLTLSSGGVLSGTPATGTAGTYGFTVRVTDSASGTSTKLYSLTIIQTDSTAPTATVAAVTSSPASAGPLTFTVTFDEPVSGLTSSDLVVGGTSTGWSIPTVTPSSGLNTVYTVTLSASTPTDGTVTLTIGTNTVADAATNTGPTAQPTAASITIASGGSSATVPGSPRRVAAGPGTERIVASWAAPASNGGSPITGYTATASPGGATCTTTNLTCAITGLTPGTRYTVTVTATNAVGTGNPSSASDATSPMGNTAPSTNAADNRPQPKVTICHKEGGPNFVAITIAPEAVVEGHTRNHPKDIIPAFDYTKNGRQFTYGGQNLTPANVALLNQGCKDAKDAPATREAPARTKVTLCHSGSGKNWVSIDVAWEAVVKVGHGDHVHDIIPPFSYVDDGVRKTYPGSNWNADNEAILDNDCDLPRAGRSQPFRSTDGSKLDPSAGNATEQSKVTICHREGGPKWVSI